MKRKIIKQANQAYTLTLPVDWVRKYRLDAGSEVDLEISERAVIVSTNSRAEGNIVELNTKNWEGKTLRSHILALYAKGADEIKIRGDKDLSREIAVALNNTLGFALVSQDKNNYTIKDLNAGYQHLDEIFKRVFQMVLIFYDSAIKDVFGKQEENFESLKMRDTEVNKFCLYLQRAINKSSYPDIVKGRALFTYSFELEKISDEIERFWRANIRFKPKKPVELKGLSEVSKEGLSMAFDSYFQSSPEMFEKIYELREKVRDKTMKLKISDPNVTRLSRHIVKIIEEAGDLNFLNIMMKY